MKHIFIVNTTSYPLETLNLIERIIEICRSLKVNYNIRCVDSREKTIKLASTFKNENAIIYAVGGDGTVNAVLNGIVGGSAFLGIVPNGASNDLFRFLNESGNESTICNVMRVNDLYCLNIFSLGIDAEICENVEKMKKFDIPRGQIYNWSIAYTFFKHKDFPVLVKADEKNFYSPSMSMVAICNGKYCENGYPINPNACIENKGSNLIMVEALKKYQMLFFVKAILSGKQDRFQNYLNLDASKVEIALDFPIIGNVDGVIIESDNFVIDSSASKINIVHNSEMLNLIRKKNT